MDCSQSAVRRRALPLPILATRRLSSLRRPRWLLRRPAQCLIACRHRLVQNTTCGQFNPIKPGQLLKLLHFAIQVKPTVFNFRQSGTLALSPGRQSARLSEIKNGRFGLYGTV